MNAAAPAGAMTVASAPPQQFARSLTNRAHTEKHISDLAANMPQLGVLQPITARPYPASRGPAPEGVLYEIIFGEGRWLAAQKAGLVEVPFFWRDVDDLTALTMQLTENIKRKDLTPLEEAAGYRRLMQDHGYSAERIASDLEVSRSGVYASLKLLDLGAAGREALEAGLLDTSKALLIARIPGETLQRKATKKITTEGAYGDPMSFRAAKDYIRYNMTMSLKQATFSLDDDSLRPEAGSCAACPKRSGNAPEICADLDDTDVCTDTACFDDKRQARREQLIAHAEERKIPVLVGDASREYRNTEDAIELDDKVDGDGQERTYRQILGNDAPVSAVIEVGWSERDKKLVEVADESALKQALVKAGWTPDLFDAAKAPEDAAIAEARRLQEEKEEAEEEARDLARTKNQLWREKLRQTLAERLRAVGNTRGFDLEATIVALAIAWVRNHVSNGDNLPAHLLVKSGIDVPDYDEYEEAEFAAACNSVCSAMTSWSMGTAMAFLFLAMTEEEETAPYHDFETRPPHGMLAAASAIEFDPESLRSAPEPVPESRQTDANSEDSIEPQQVPASGAGAEIFTWKLKRKHWVKLHVLQVSDGWLWGTECQLNSRRATPFAQESQLPSREDAIAAGSLHLTEMANVEPGLFPTPTDRKEFCKWAIKLVSDVRDETSASSAPAAPPWPFPTGAIRQAKWPEPNEHGVYPEDKAEHITISPAKNQYARISVLQIAETEWLGTNHIQYGSGGWGGPLTTNHCDPHPSRDEAIRTEATDVFTRCADRNDTFKAPQLKKVLAWAKDLANNGEAATVLKAATADKVPGAPA